MARFTSVVFAALLFVPALAAAQQPVVVAVSSDPSCATPDATEALAEAVRQQMRDAIVIVASEAIPPHDTSVAWIPSDDGCALSIQSNGTSARMELEANADTSAIHEAAVRVAWLAELQGGDVFGRSEDPAPDDRRFAAQPPILTADAAEPTVEGTVEVPVEDEVAMAEEALAVEAPTADEGAVVEEEITFVEVPELALEAAVALEPVPEGVDEAVGADAPSEVDGEVEAVSSTRLDTDAEQATPTPLLVSDDAQPIEPAAQDDMTEAVDTAPEDAPVLQPYPLGVSLVPGLEFPAGSGLGARREVSLGIISATGAVDGIEMTLGAGYVEYDVDGVQISAGANLVSGEVRGAQLASGFNLANSLDGLQIAPVNVVLEDAEGFQAGSVNVAAGDVDGFQAGVVNIGEHVDGFQAGVVNLGDDVNVQAGVVNVAEDTEVQVGLVNVARSSDLSLGLVSIVLDQPLNVYAALDADAVTAVGLRHGSPYFQSILEFQSPLDARPNRLGGGFGGRIPIGSLWLELDAVVLWVMADAARPQSSPPLYGELRATLGWQLARRFAIFGGLTQNVYWTSSLQDADYVGMGTTPIDLAPDSFLWTFPGARLGVRF